ncbi:MAG: primosomal protein N' [Lachnospiraceae bacterium]|nr:primosomal protein N' [Lachnospiraceae bacterium]
MKLYADVIIDISHEAIDRVFQYEVPLFLCDEIKIGVQVLVPFGAGNHQRKGYVIELKSTPDYDIAKIKSLIGVVSKSVPIEGEMIQLADFLKRQYGSTMINALKTVVMIPDKVKDKEQKIYTLAITKEEADRKKAAYDRTVKFKTRGKVLELLMEQDSLTKEGAQRAGISDTILKNLEKEGILKISTKKQYRNPVMLKKEELETVSLNEEQQSAFNVFREDFKEHRYHTYLLYGITGSGKTQVYMAMIEEVVKSGKQAILLIPEISLTYQNISRFQKRFGERVTIIHSKLSKGEKFDQFERARQGEVDVVIGPRSALFAPFNNLGVIIIDEEHENSYKSDNPPKYHSREVAIERARICGASVVLGSATPAIESFTKAKLGEYKLLTLSKRATKGELAEVSVVDLREELRAGNRSIFSRELKERMQECLAAKKQMMLFLNRRGYAGFVSCRSCGHVIKCPHCDISLTYHKDGNLHCHYCGFWQPYHKKCPNCGSAYIGTFGIGTQKVEEVIYREFPGARVLRMDFDTTKGKNSHQEILQKFSQGQADILLGTQMIVKGHDFPNVTLVGVIAADLTLASHDYRSNEVTFSLLTQAAGRAGRGEEKGHVVIQTYQPEHYSILAAAKQDYNGFYEMEYTYRQLLKYPPVYQMLVILVTGKEESSVSDFSAELATEIKNQFEKVKELQVLGPNKAGVLKISDIFRYVIYLKHVDYEILVQIKDDLEKKIKENVSKKDIYVFFDFNPMHTY